MADHDLTAVNLTVGQKRRRPRRARVDTMLKLAAAAGKNVTSIVMPDGTTLNFGEPAPAEVANPWLADLDKATRQ
jgi:hypothetical protein